MYQLNYIIPIDIQLDNGLYTFYPESGMGKSRLYHLVREYMTNPKLDAYAVTYADLNRGERVQEEVEKRKPKLIIFDRYNMYKRQFLDVIKEYKDKAIILVDYKGISDVFDGMPDEQCVLELKADRIEVRL